jgi:hypothetical protein
MVVAAPVMAEENASFLALKDLPERPGALSGLTPLNESELAAIEGGQGDLVQGLILQVLGSAVPSIDLNALSLAQTQNIAGPQNLQFGNETRGNFSQTVSQGPQSVVMP